MILQKTTIVCLFMLLFGANVSTQIPPEDLRKAYEDGEYFVAYGDYQEALYNFLRITQKGISNANIQYRIGFCYINMDGQKTKAIPHLEEAIKSVSVEYTEGNAKETQAPIEAFYYLAMAYQTNHQFDKAIELYRKYIGLLPKEDEINLKYTRQQIRTCGNAKESMAEDKSAADCVQPIDAVNNNFNNIRPVISGDGQTLAFVSKERFYDALYVTTRDTTNDEWRSPRNINAEIMSDGDFYPVSLSHDGQELILVKEDPFNSNVFIARFDDSLSTWQKLEELSQVNSRFWESAASMSSDGKTIYFASNRRGTTGGSDIFSITKDDRGRWGKPENLGPNINTEFNEDRPLISQDGNRLYFSSQGHRSNLGSYDIYYVTKTNSGWSKPVNMGYPINTPDEDLYYSIDEVSQKVYFERMNNNPRKPSMNIFFSTF